MGTRKRGRLSDVEARMMLDNHLTDDEIMEASHVLRRISSHVTMLMAELSDTLQFVKKISKDVDCEYHAEAEAILATAKRRIRSQIDETRSVMNDGQEK